VVRLRRRAASAARERGVEAAGRRYLLYVLLPVWFVPAVLDYLMHRRSHIEGTAGPRESLVHSVMMAEIGVPTWIGLLCEVSPGMLAAMAAAAVVHDATAILDARTAVRGGRQLSPVEMNIHSFLEALPFTALGVLCCLHWDELRELTSRPSRRWWRMELKHEPLPPRYLAGIAAATVTLTEFFDRAGMQGTKLREQTSKDDPAEVAGEGFEALMAGQDHVVAGSAKNKAQVASGRLMPETAKAAMQARQTQPGTGGRPD
jgi:hypothetical protein